MVRGTARLRSSIFSPSATASLTRLPAAATSPPPLRAARTQCPPTRCYLYAGEQRAQVKGIKERSLVNKAKNEAKRELEEAQVGGCRLTMHAVQVLLHNSAGLQRVIVTA